ncbi:MAG TPA: oxygenase MpaB family protein [Sphingobacteriaceae bacterium]
MNFFVQEDSVVRQIWGKADTILFIFAGASAEFALNKAVDWLYYTGKIPSDPLGRLFSTVDYARMIVFSEEQQALEAIDRMNHIHGSIESSRGAKIPDWAYRDVLFMLIDYSIRAFEVLERPLTADEKQETFDVFYRVGARMGIPGLPGNFDQWLLMRDEHLKQNLMKSHFTVDLYKQYRKHLGPVRFLLLLQAQSLVTPPVVRNYLSLNGRSLLRIILPVYKISRRFKMDHLIKKLILPPGYHQQINSLDRV